MSLFLLIIAFIVSFLFSLFTLPKIILLSLEKKLFDSIGTRKVHKTVASRLGGVVFFPAIFLGISVSLALVNIHSPESLTSSQLIKYLLQISAVLILYVVGVFDDLLGLKYRIKFIFQIISATLIITSGVYIDSFQGFLNIGDIPYYISLPLTTFLIVFITNSINLIDGIDGLSSLLSILAIFVYGILLINKGTVIDSTFAISTLGALIPFAVINIKGFRKRSHTKIFMGDGGTLVVGTILSILAIKVWNLGATDYTTDELYPITAFTMLLIPCFDVVRVVLRRARNRKPLFLPDRNHIHHKYIDLGLNPIQCLTYIQVQNVIFVALNFVMLHFLSLTEIVFIDILIWTLSHVIITRKIVKRNKK